jgi:hypothetical protein
VVIGVFRHHVVWVLLLFAASASAAAAQGGSDSERQSSEPQSGEKVPTQPERRTVGTVAALGRGSIVIRTDQDKFVVYELTQRTVRTKVVEPGARVSILTLSSDTAPAPRALAITVLPGKQGLAEPAESAESAEIEPNVPQQVQQLTTQIERQARRFRAGLTGGVAIDPELISLDAFATFGPFFTRNLQFRPNLEFAFGEVTTLFGIHLDAIYTLPGVSRAIRWAPYLGAGPSFTFSHRGFEEVDVDSETDEVDRFNFDDFQWHNGFNFIVGARNPNGVFFEMKSTAWGAANIRVLAGFEF